MNASDAVTNLILETFRLNGSLLAAGDAMVADFGLTSARWQVLGAIALSPVPLPVAHIARNMGLSRQAVQRLVNEMARDGLVRFAPNPHHKRAQLIRLTARGEAAYSAAMQRQAPWAKAIARGLTVKQIADATAVLQSLQQHLAAAAGKDAVNV
ncbi:MAG: MarR family transcriptional regulator [Alphaproteobacteria bacterium]